MDEILDILTEFVPIESLASIIAGLAVIAGGVVLVLRYGINFTALPGPELAIGLALIIGGAILYAFSSVAGEVLEMFMG